MEPYSKDSCIMAVRFRDKQWLVVPWALRAYCQQNRKRVIAKIRYHSGGFGQGSYQHIAFYSGSIKLFQGRSFLPGFWLKSAVKHYDISLRKFCCQFLGKAYLCNPSCM